jgi:hypothetical protein
MLEIQVLAWDMHNNEVEYDSMYLSWYQAYFEYANIIWDNISAYLYEKLEKMDKCWPLYL